MMYDTEHTIQKPMPPSHTSTHHNRESWHLPLVGRNFAFWTQCQTQHPRKVALVAASQASYFKGLFWKQQIYMYGHLVSAAYAMREYKLLMARGGMNQAQIMLSARPCASQTPTIQPCCIRVFANTRQFASCQPGPLFCANCRIRRSVFACQITFFLK